MKSGLPPRPSHNAVDRPSRPPTIRELLTHTAGLSYNFINNPRLVDAYREARVTDGLDQPEVTTAEAMQRLASVPLGYHHPVWP